MKPLEGIKVLDLSRVLAGPWCTQLLADLGAEVIKIERPGAGDDTRHWGPPWHGEGEDRVAAYFLSCNRGKKSAAIDFAQPEGAALVRQLAGRRRRRRREFQGRRPREVRARRERRCERPIRGWSTPRSPASGRTAPTPSAPGYDFIIQGMGGMMSVTGLPDGEPGGGPMRAGVAIADLFTGMYTCVAILAALYRRERSGEGAHIDMALFDTQIAVMANQASNASVSGKDPPRQGNTHPNIVPYQPFDAADQPIIIAVGNDRQFARLAEICGHPEWADRRAFRNQRRARREPRRDRRAGRATASGEGRRRSGWNGSRRAGIPAGPINRITPGARGRSGAASPDGADDCRRAAGRIAGAARRRARRTADLPPPASASIRREVLAGLGLDAARGRAAQGRRTSVG